MRYTMVSVFDRAAECFGVPQFCATPAQALRGFRDQVNRKGDGNVVADHPEDFDLYEVGQFNDSDGYVDMCKNEEEKIVPRLIARGKDLVVQS